jgi:hypothetical protein
VEGDFPLAVAAGLLLFVGLISGIRSGHIVCIWLLG